MATARSLTGGPVEMHFAMGHGRSYGAWSSVPGRSLPGITQCELWAALPGLTPAPTVALITDVGNDLLYNVEPHSLVDWVSDCCDQLAAVGAEIVLTELPIANLSTLGSTRYQLFRTVWFPRCRLSLAEMSQRAKNVNEGLHRIAQRPEVTIKPLLAEWYGFDPIHIRVPQYFVAWKKILEDAQSCAMPTAVQRVSLLKRYELFVATPAHRKLLGISRRRKQPSCTLSDGTSISFF